LRVVYHATEKTAFAVALGGPEQYNQVPSRGRRAPARGARFGSVHLELPRVSGCSPTGSWAAGTRLQLL